METENGIALDVNSARLHGHNIGMPLLTRNTNKVLTFEYFAIGSQKKLEIKRTKKTEYGFYAPSNFADLDDLGANFLSFFNLHDDLDGELTFHTEK